MGRGSQSRGSSRGSGNRVWSKKFCRICYHAGSEPSRYQNHTISECEWLTTADKSNLRAVLGSGKAEDQEEVYDDERHEAYEVPGWDVNENDPEDEINVKESYLTSLSVATSVKLSTITPIPSQILSTSYNNLAMHITLDSGATLSFIRQNVVQRLNLVIGPNGQLAILADEETRMSSLGEVDFEVSFHGFQLRVRALVMEKLQADCFGGTNFHKDNKITSDIDNGLVKIHGQFTIKQSNPVMTIQSFPPSRIETTPQSEVNTMATDQVGEENMTKDFEVKYPTISVPHRQTALPGEAIYVPLPGSLAKLSRVSILPSFHPRDSGAWPPQVCGVEDGKAMYVNISKDNSISHPKFAHFKTLPVKKADFSNPKSITSTKSPVIPPNPRRVEDLIKDIQINEKLLSKPQLAKLKEINTRNCDVFDGDLSVGYNHHAGRYSASFSFKESSKPPPLKVWAPQYNRSCSELLQAKCDQLEIQGVLVDPAKHGIDIKHVSPIFIQQKGRARHKQLPDCTLDEIRFISCQNVLNESIRPIQSSSCSHVKIFKFLARWKYHISADLHNSYFQIPIDKKLWGYLAVNTPFRGIRVMTRTGQGLLNSDVHLDQLVFRVLGDELAEGICEVARDDIEIGGNTLDELIQNYDTVISKLNRSNLKITAQKVRILLEDSEVFGFRIKQGYVMPSSHNISNLGETKLEDLTTIKKVNSWKGLYKTLIAHLPHLAFYMAPFDKACGGKPSRDKFDWTPEMRAAFNSASSHLSNINKTFLPNPNDKLILKPDTAKINTCTGWALYAARETSDGVKLLPVQYCSAKLPTYMSKWYPCELEAVGAVLSIEQVAHWINESNHRTTVMPDSMPVVKAANLMKNGKHSKNPRLQSLLSCVNRRKVIFVHSSAKNGFHIVPDTLSRIDHHCDCGDCGIKRFLDEIPETVESMAVQVPEDVSSAILRNLEPCQIAVMSGELNDMLVNKVGAIPFGNKKAWLEIQKSDPDCRVVHSIKISGNLPSRKNSNKNLNRIYRECSVSEDGLLVVNRFDNRTMRHSDRIVVPQSFLMSILSLIHIRISHPKTHQLQAVFEKYFFSIGVLEACKELRQSCDICIGLDKLPREMEEYDPKLAPSHPGTHMNADVIRRAGQKILINTDLFSGYTTASFTDSENSEDLAEAIIKVVTPIRHSASIIVRVDKAGAFVSLSKSGSEILERNGLSIELGDDLNKNSNCSVDRKIQELEEEFKRLSPEGEKLTLGELAQAVTLLNNRIRNQDLTAAEIHFSRDSTRGENLQLDDKALIEEKVAMRSENHKHSIKSKARGGRDCEVPDCKPGDIVYVKSQGSKHETKNPYIVTEDGEDLSKVVIRKVLHPHTTVSKSPTFSSDKKVVDRKFLFRPSRRSPFVEGRYDVDDANGDQPELEADYDDEEYYDEEDNEEYLDYGEYEEDESSDSRGSDEDSVLAWNPTPSYEDDWPEMSPIVYRPESGWLDDNVITDEGQNIEAEMDVQAQFSLRQERIPKRGDKILLFNDRVGLWMFVTLTSDMIKYYRSTGPYFNFRSEDGSTGGQYLHYGGRWSYVNDAEMAVLELDSLVQVLPVVVGQLDRGITPESLTPESTSPPGNLDSAILDLDSPREVRQQRRWQDVGELEEAAVTPRHRSYSLRSMGANTALEGEFADDNFSDQESVFGQGERDFVLQRLDVMFSTDHTNFASSSEEDGDLRRQRLSQSLDLCLPKDTGYPSAASFPGSDFYPVLTPIRTRVLSFSSPDLYGEGQTASSWQEWKARLWGLGRELRRRLR